MDRRHADIRLSFNEVPDVYDEVRPSHPAELYATLFAMLPPHPSIVEVGPGTGQATSVRISAVSASPIDIRPDGKSITPSKRSS